MTVSVLRHDNLCNNNHHHHLLQLIFELHHFEGILTVGVNSHQEVCALQQRGCLLTTDQISLCIALACARAAEITETIKQTLSPPVVSKHSQEGTSCKNMDQQNVQPNEADDESE